VLSGVLCCSSSGCVGVDVLVMKGDDRIGSAIMVCVKRNPAMNATFCITGRPELVVHMDRS
jgi:hypothetical protein